MRGERGRQAILEPWDTEAILSAGSDFSLNKGRLQHVPVWLMKGLHCDLRPKFVTYKMHSFASSVYILLLNFGIGRQDPE